MLSSIRQILGAEDIVWVLRAKSTHCFYFTKNTCKLKMYWVYYTCSTKNARRLSPIFLSIGMHCLGCPSSRGETVEQACMVHDVDVDALLDKLNATIA